MTRTANARLAGATFLAYIALGIASLVLFSQAAGTGEPAQRLAALASHLAPARASLVLGLSTGFVALALGVALYGLTQQVDPHIALLALSCRVVEGAMAAVGTMLSLALLALASGQVAVDPQIRVGLGTLLLSSDQWLTTVSATFFAVGSTFFCYLLLRGRVIPVLLARIGLGASVLLVVGLPARAIELIPSSLAMWMWLPMLLFEVPCGLWLLFTKTLSATEA